MKFFCRLFLWLTHWFGLSSRSRYTCKCLLYSIIFLRYCGQCFCVLVRFFNETLALIYIIDPVFAMVIEVKGGGLAWLHPHPSQARLSFLSWWYVRHKSTFAARCVLCEWNYRREGYLQVIVEHRHQGICPRHTTFLSSTGYRTGLPYSTPVPEWFQHLHSFSFRYRTDRIPHTLLYMFYSFHPKIIQYTYIVIRKVRHIKKTRKNASDAS
jgi:hypothetical protein